MERARVTRAASFLAVAAVVMMPARGDARPLLPGLLQNVAPSALTTSFERCMSGQPRGAVPAPNAPAPVDPAGRVPVAAIPVATATPSAAGHRIPSEAACLAQMGFGDRPALRDQIALCVSQKGVVRTVCLNRVFAALAPVSLASLPPKSPPPTAVPTATPRPTPTPTSPPTPTPRPTHTRTPRPTPTPTPHPTRTPTPRPTPTPQRTPTPRPTGTPQPRHTSPVLAAVVTTPSATPRPAATATPVPTPAPTATPVVQSAVPPWVMPALSAFGGAFVLAGIVIVIYRRLKEPPQMHRLTIAAPADASIAVAGVPVTFSAQTDPPRLAAAISWSVTTQPGVHGIGPSFTHTFTATGVEQVVARLAGDALACDVIVYVFKTRSGGSTLADFMQAEPPPAARRADSFTRYGTTAAAPGKAS